MSFKAFAFDASALIHIKKHLRLINYNKKTGNPKEKWAMDLSRFLSKDIQVAIKT